MIENFKNQYTSFRILVILSIIAVSIYLFQIFWQVLSNFSDILVMLVLAWLLSFVLEPLVNFVSKVTKLSKLFSALIIYLFFAILFAVGIFLFIPIVIEQLQSLSKVVPKFLSTYPAFAQAWNNSIARSLDILITLLPSLATIVIDTILMLILSFYLIVDKERINNEIYSLLPMSFRKHFKFIQVVIDTTFSSFFRIQIIFGIIAAISTWIVMTAWGVNFAASASLIAGILTVIPVLGQFLGAIPPAFVVLVTRPDAPLEAVLVFAILVGIQQVAFNVLGPKLMGNAFKLHPIIVFLSIIIGFKIAGAIGAVFVVPLLAIAVIVIKQLGIYFINPQEASENK
ncbi:MAG: AI-2E family transporter [Candidatus Levybacteria bacterium]|nr:AI-2E family transporter [Candidatus Levybacteria bacterium]